MSKLKTTALKLLSLSLLLYAFTFTLFASPVHAQTPTSPSASALPPSVYSLPSTVSPTSPLFTDLLLHNVFHSFSCLAVGQSVIGQPCLTYQMTKNAEGVMQGVPVLSSVNTSGGVLGTTTSLIGALYANPPIRTADYLASVGQDLGIVKVANAQVIGSGAKVLSPILALWTVSRNFSYVIMIIIFLVIGLMVMFRQRINPQTVITAQAALPGLVIGLVLIYFSYFLAGLISDTAFVGTNIVGYYFGSVRGNTNQNLVDDISKKNVLSIFTPFTKVVNRGEVDSALGSIWDDLKDKNVSGWNPFDQNSLLALDPQKVIMLLTGFITSQVLSPFAGMLGGWSQVGVAVISAAGGGVAPIAIASFALSFIAMAILIYTMFKLLLRLVNAFLTIIFYTVTAPFHFLMASLPGRQGIATNWILNMLGNILIFPTVLAVLYFVAYLLGPTNSINTICKQIEDDAVKAGGPPAPCPFKISQTNLAPDNNFGSLVYAAQSGSVQQPTIVGEKGFPLFGGMSLGLVQLLLAFGALVALPRIPDIVVSTVGKVGQAGQLIGQEIGGSVGQGRHYASQIQQGVGGIGQSIGRFTNEEHYGWDPTITDKSGKIVGGWAPSPYQSRGGQGTRIKAGFDTRVARFKAPGPWYKKIF